MNSFFLFSMIKPTDNVLILAQWYIPLLSWPLCWSSSNTGMAYYGIRFGSNLRQVNTLEIEVSVELKEQRYRNIRFVRLEQ